MRRKSTETVTHRGQAVPPNTLAEFIEMVNMERLFERELPDVGAGPGAPMDDPKNRTISPYDPWVKLCRATANTLSTQTRAFLGPSRDLVRFLEKYELLRS